MAVEIDSIVIQKARNGDMRATERILEAFSRQIYAMAYRICASEQDALDIAQETAVRIWRNLPDFRGEAKLSTWIHRITHNTCVDFLRKKRENTVDLDSLVQGGVQLTAPLADTPEQVINRKETYARVEEALLALPEDQRAAVIQRDVMGLAYDEIASAQDANLNTVKSRISRGRKSLMALLKSGEGGV